MNWSYRAFWIAVVASMVTLMMTACGKKNDGPSIGLVGNVSVDSTGIISNSSIDGYNVNFEITQLGLTPASNQTMGYYNYNNTNFSSQNITMTLAVNGISKNYIIVPNTTVNGATPASDIIGNFQVYYDARCLDYGCANTYVVVWLGMANLPEWKEVGIYKMMNLPQVGSAVSLQGTSSQLVTTDVMVQQLQAAYNTK